MSQPPNPRSIVVRPAALEETIDLRHAVLRQGLPRDAATFPGDDAPGSIHFAAFDRHSHRRQAVGCLTLHLNQWQGGQAGAGEPAWQLRGMACREDWRRLGVGRTLMDAAEAHVRAHPPHLLWCNARTPAVGFYQRLGWTVMSDVFEIPTAGPHVKMIKRLE